jgi:signal transduction histidine kinase
MSLIRSPFARAVVLDGLVIALATPLVLLGTRQTALAGMGSRGLDAPAYAIMAAALASLAARRVWPLATLAVTIALSVAYLGAGYPVGPFFLVPAIAMYSFAVRSPVRGSLVAFAVSFLALLAGHTVALVSAGDTDLLTQLAEGAPWAAGWLGLPLAIGAVVRLSRQEATRERQEQARRSAYEERLRVARDVHDVVGHGLAVINMQAGIALHVLGKRPDQAQVALEAIKTTSKDALDELRGTLAVFRRPDEADAPRRPTPGLDQLEALAADMSDNGLPVEVVVSGERAGLPGAVDVAAYRIVQESLTNVLRHAGRAKATVRVSYGPEAVDLEITDDGRGLSPRGGNGHRGHGITGMRERAAVIGGSVETGPREGGGFRVHARLPAGEERR